MDSMSGSKYATAIATTTKHTITQTVQTATILAHTHTNTRVAKNICIK